MTVTPSAAHDVSRVADGVRRAIVDGEYVPDQRLVEADLADRFGASRATVRSALLTLESDRLVTRSHNRGARVRTVSVDEAVEITEVRMVVEALCAAKAAERAGAGEIHELRSIIAAMRRAVRAADMGGYSSLNRSLHAAIIEASGQRTAAAELERLRAQLVRHQFRLAMRPGRIDRSLGQHEAVTEAIAAHDPRAAERAMRAHLSSVIAALRATPAGDPRIA